MLARERILGKKTQYLINTLYFFYFISCKERTRYSLVCRRYMMTVLRTTAELLAAVIMLYWQKKFSQRLKGEVELTTVTENRKVGTQYSGL